MHELDTDLTVLLEMSMLILEQNRVYMKGLKDKRATVLRCRLDQHEAGLQQAFKLKNLSLMQGHAHALARTSQRMLSETQKDVRRVAAQTHPLVFSPTRLPLR